MSLEPQTRRRLVGRVPARAAMVGLSACLAGLVGCAGTTAGRQDARAVEPSGPVGTALVFVTPETRLALAGEPVGEAPSRSWAFSRTDPSLAVRTREALLATEEWPEPLPPPERPVLFRRWVQH